MDEEPRKRGRPRKNVDQLARWTPPEGWVRVVAWVSPEERRELKRIAVEADTSVAELIRALANGLEQGVVSSDELLTKIREVRSVMDKIPTVFERDEAFRVVNKVKPGCEWVLDGEGQATEKLDGANVRLTIRSGQCVRLEKRRNPTKRQKAAGIIDGWYVDADDSGPEDKWIYEAMQNTDVASWPDGEHSAEALGPRIQGNPLGLEAHCCMPFNLNAPVYEALPRNFEALAEVLVELESKYAPSKLAEGVVFHHPDGRRAKIKRKDFG